jgi:hypothetical protein
MQFLKSFRWQPLLFRPIRRESYITLATELRFKPHIVTSRKTSIRFVNENSWASDRLKELGEEQKHPTPIYCDNSSAVQLCHNPVCCL